MDMSPVGLGTKNNCAGEDPQQFSSQLLDWLHIDLSQKAKTKTNDRPDLSSEGASDIDKTVNVNQ
jgi:hypothetical protein